MDHAIVVEEKTFSSLVHSSVHLRCHPGHHFRNGKFEIHIRCQDNGEWEDVNDCEGNRNNIGHNSKIFPLSDLPCMSHNNNYISLTLC